MEENGQRAKETERWTEKRDHPQEKLREKERTRVRETEERSLVCFEEFHCQPSGDREGMGGDECACPEVIVLNPSKQ